MSSRAHTGETKIAASGMAVERNMEENKGVDRGSTCQPGVFFETHKPFTILTGKGACQYTNRCFGTTASNTWWLEPVMSLESVIFGPRMHEESLTTRTCGLALASRSFI